MQKIEVDEKDGHGMGKVVSMDVGMFGRHLKYTVRNVHTRSGLNTALARQAYGIADEAVRAVAATGVSAMREGV